VAKLIYAYPFAKTGGEYYPYFRKDKFVRQVKYQPGVAVHGTWDFNVVPFMTHVCAQIQFLTRYLDEVGNKYDEPQPGYKAIEVMRISFYKEYCLKSPLNTTEAVCDAFLEDHDPMYCELTYYGDASGLHRIPGLGSHTNFKTVEEKLFAFLHNGSKQVRDPNVGVFKRRDLLNKIFKGDIPEVEIEFDEDNCPETIADFENVKLGPKGKAKSSTEDKDTGEKFQKWGHPTDAVEYLVSEVCKHYIV
jgi:hypothetical protein